MSSEPGGEASVPVSAKSALAGFEEPVEPAAVGPVFASAAVVALEIRGYLTHRDDDLCGEDGPEDGILRWCRISVGPVDGSELRATSGPRSGVRP